MSTNLEPVRWARRFDRGEIRRLVAMYGVIAALHIAGFGLFAYYNARYHDLADSRGELLYAGAAGLAYTLGMRHAFDADHISAIDDTTRYLLQKGKRPLGVGLAFSLGHSTIVFALSVGIAFAAQAANRFQSGFADIGGIIGTLVSGVFLYAIAALNLAVLRGIIRTWREAKAGRHQPEELEQLLAARGLMNRVFKGRYNRFIDHSWQLYFVGLLFGLGFDTATQVGALGLAAGSAADGTLPPLVIIALPLIFAAGMSLMDTTDGVFMAKAYEWSFTNPVRKIYYNLTMTGLSIFVAFVVGTIELVSLLAERLGVDGRQPWKLLGGIDLNAIGIAIVVTFLVTWIGAVVLWKVRRYDERYARPRIGEPGDPDPAVT
ncbi:HoxN/HupN/NixA family nickel/cobalt transporter [Streptomyces ipomoeae]|uniref:Nickel/cobalt efflux system n=1 Tax=Streptomyces ipomoeae 91-03 TaxID=698759 RepID=L1KLZ6_9ACTN|nr:HoxN/HupN/NixA family nickel/cobalt transporter [Streptomyces ipomoeae]EKX61584.1 transition metal uptake transporter, Ni2+-Co2+ transporter (NiCoT) family protein [Streptomyces ipomoeae 91-03]MDX2694060.1 HoxN/HupN/NixA family nickel/cobalt transporter [Streptomyces ipomoeae]MDX2839944.1 HoxN/HupN/NixA family nickel/cobalt transporter [Streptomyces ipomoeae]